MAIFLFIVLVAVALGIIGAVVKGLIFLLVIGVIIFLASFVILGFRLRGRRHRPRPRRRHVVRGADPGRPARLRPDSAGTAP